jgi:hypothetical protein
MRSDFAAGGSESTPAWFIVYDAAVARVALLKRFPYRGITGRK